MSNIVLLGVKSIYTNETSIGKNEIEASQYTALETGTVENIELYIGATASTAKSIIVGIYEDSNGVPGKALDEGTYALAPGTSQWISVSELTARVVKGYKYWIAWLPRGGNLHTVYSNGASPNAYTTTGKYAVLEATTNFHAETIGPFSALATGEAEPPLVFIAPNIREQFPLKLAINNEDYSYLLSENFTFSNVDPGGFETASFPIPKDLPQITRGMPVRLDCGTKIAWEGRVKELQRSMGAKTLIQCEGKASKLKETSIAEIFVDRELTSWRSMSLARQISTIETGFSPSGPEVGLSPTNTTPALIQAVNGAWVAGGLPWNEATYNSNGVPIGAVYLNWTRGINVGKTTTQWTWEANLSDTETGGGGDIGVGNLRERETPEYILATTNTRAIARFVYTYNEAGGTAGKQYAIYWNNPSVYGRHGLTKQGADPGGFFPSQIVEFVVGKVEEIGLGIIEVPTYIIPHSSYLSPVPSEQIVSEMTKVVGWHWGVWESLYYLTQTYYPEPRLDFRAYPKPGTFTAWAWRSECETLDIRENIENLYNSAKVIYTEISGVEGTVEVKRSNKYLAALEINRQIVINMGTSTKAAAEAFGLIQLELLESQANVTGTATITMPVHEARGSGVKPAWMLRSGIDRFRVPDAPSKDVWGEHNDYSINRVECSAGENGITTTIEFGTTPNLIETLQAQLQNASVASGIS
jgi:hypothetical protein